MVIGAIGQRRRGMCVSLISRCPLGLSTLFIGVINLDSRIIDIDRIFMIAGSLRGCGIPMVGLHHRTVVLAQFVSLGQWLTHNFPAVLIKQNHLRFKRGLHELKFTL